MPTSDSPPDFLVDSSVAVPLVIDGHDHHETTVEAIGSRRLGMAGHAAFETYSVLTRLPPPARLLPEQVSQVLRENFPASRFLSADGAEALWRGLSRLRIGGGSVYDALVGAAAREHDLVLATRDRRAIPTYRALEVRIEVIAGGGEATGSGALA